VSDDSGGLLRSSGVMAVGTLLSRALGFIRVVVFAAALGATTVIDVFTVANTVPNMIYILLAGGILNTIFVPQLVRSMRNDPDGGRAYADRLLTVTGVALLAIAVVATASAPLLMRLFGGANYTEADLALATAFALWCLPQIFFYGAYTMIGQVLNARGSFGPMMWAPIANNIVAIAAGLLFIAVADVVPSESASVAAGEVALIAGGSTLGVAVQALVLLPVLRRVGFRYRARFDWRGVGLGKAGQLAKWTLLYVLANQLGYLVIVKLTATAGKAAEEAVGYGAGVFAYQSAYLVFLLPHAIITVSVVTALMPRLSAAAADGRLRGVRADVSRGLRLLGVATVPAALAFLVLGPDLATVMFARGNTSVESARSIGLVLASFGPGLVFFSAHYLLLRGFYAREDTRTPFFMTLVINAVLLTGALTAFAVLPAEHVVAGVAASYALAYAVGLAVSAAVLRRALGGLDGRRVIRTHVRLVLAGAVAAGAAYVVARVATTTLGADVTGSLVASVAGAAVLAGVYLAGARLMHITEVTGLLGMVRGRLGH
jgi:putative peptidoglycan lipid II flippase